MAPISGSLQSLTPDNSTSVPNPFLEFTNPTFGPAIQVVLFFVGVCVVPTLTAHTPIPVSREDTFGRTVTMILSPISASIVAFNSIVIFAVKIGRHHNWGRARRRNFSSHHDVISAGALAICIPNRLDNMQESPFEWRRFDSDFAMVQGAAHGIRNADLDETTLYSLPPTSQFQSNSLKVFSSSSRLKTAFAILQLAYSVAQAYIQYNPIIRGRGISTPFIIVVSYLYASFINLIANLVQGSYTHVIIIPPTLPTTVSLPSLSTVPAVENNLTDHLSAARITPQMESDAVSNSSHPEVERQVETNASQSQSPPEELNNLRIDDWLQTHYPQIKFDDLSGLATIAFYIHYSIALTTLLISIGVLTNFQPGDSPVLLLAVLSDPVAHVLLAIAQSWKRWPRWLQKCLHSVWGIAVVKLGIWICSLLGWVYTTRLLFEIYQGNYLSG
jgi:hypothetical protein